MIVSIQTFATLKYDALIKFYKIMELSTFNFFNFSKLRIFTENCYLSN